MYIDYVKNISYIENLEIALKFWKMGNQAITTEEIDGISVRSNEHKLCT